MPTIRAEIPDHRKAESNYIGLCQQNVYSQTGEDGVIQKLFEIITPNNKWCVEFGAWDGVFLSNTCNLVRNHMWSSILIEGDPKRCEEIRTNFPDNPRVYARNEMVGFVKGHDTIDDILKKTPIPQDFDFISIDVDGIDWYIWESIVDHRPRVVVTEFNPVIPNHVYFVQDRDMSIKEGASLRAFVELGRLKGYELAAVTNANAFFIVKEEFHKLNIDDNSIGSMRLDRANYIFHGYNGKIYHTMPRLNWYGKHVDLQNDSLQLLSIHSSTHTKVDGAERGTKNGDFDLTTADGLVRELYALRSLKRSIPAEEYGRRALAVWVAVKTYTDRNMPWGAVERAVGE